MMRINTCKEIGICYLRTILNVHTYALTRTSYKIRLQLTKVTLKLLSSNAHIYFYEWKEVDPCKEIGNRKRGAQ